MMDVLAVLINVILVLGGSVLGLLVKSRFTPRLGDAVIKAIGLCTIGIGMGSLLKTRDTLCVIICMVVGTLLGELIGIERHMDNAGEGLKRKLMKEGSDSRFVEAFVTGTVLFCVGAMAINGAIDAGLRGDFTVLVSKSVMDGVTSITFAAAMGVGVAFSAIPIFLYEGALVLLAGAVGPYLSPEVITEMSAVGGAIIVGISINQLGLSREKIRIGNMLPAIFLPIAYLPLAQWLGSLAG